MVLAFTFPVICASVKSVHPENAPDFRIVPLNVIASNAIQSLNAYSLIVETLLKSTLVNALQFSNALASIFPTLSAKTTSVTFVFLKNVEGIVSPNTAELSFVTTVNGSPFSSTALSLYPNTLPPTAIILCVSYQLFPSKSAIVRLSTIVESNPVILNDVNFEQPLIEFLLQYVNVALIVNDSKLV